MENKELKELIRQGFLAMKAGTKVAADATTDTSTDSSVSELSTALKESSKTAKEWEIRISRGLEEAGGGDEQENLILKAHYEVAENIIKQAPDEYSKNLGIIASGQLALHYWIAAFGTMLSYAKEAGLETTVKEMELCLDEAKAADDHYNKIASSILVTNR